VKGPQLAGCPVFPADNVWNTRVDGLPKDARSDAYIDSIGVRQRLHADFGSGEYQGIPVTVLGARTPAAVEPAKVRFQYDDESDHVAYPLFRGVAIEGGYSSPGDRHVVMVDPKDCALYELWHVSLEKGPGNNWTAGSGVKMDLRSDALRPEGMTSADAAGLAILPGLVRYEEMAAGDIDHAIRFTIPTNQIGHEYVWPGRHQASRVTNPALPPYGARLRLRADFDITRFPKCDRVILTALQRYGMILADGGAAIFLSGAPDSRWNDDDLHELDSVKGEDFEVVDESWLMVGKDSGATRKTAVRGK
jgi:hypothetical protein